MSTSIPAGFTTLTPMLVLKDARKAIDFYQRAFGAEERYVMPGPDGRGVMHAEIRIGNSILMFGEENPQQACKSAESFGGSPVSFYLYFDDVDAAFARALKAGGEALMPVTEMFWGDRIGTLQDPFGYTWTVATQVKELTDEEVRAGAQAFFAAMAKESACGN